MHFIWKEFNESADGDHELFNDANTQQLRSDGPILSIR